MYDRVLPDEVVIDTLESYFEEVTRYLRTEREADERFMRAVEELIGDELIGGGIPPHEADDYRRSIVAYYASSNFRDVAFRPMALMRAIEKYLRLNERNEDWKRDGF